MNIATYIAIFLPILFLLSEERSNKKKALVRNIINAKNKGERAEMITLAKNFIGKECLIYTFNSQITGIIKEVSDGGMLVENKGQVEVINLEYVVRIREYPKGKNGKKKSVILD